MQKNYPIKLPVIRDEIQSVDGNKVELKPGLTGEAIKNLSIACTSITPINKENK